MVSGALFLLLFTLVLSTIQSRASICKPLVTSSEWPSQQAWQGLNTSTFGNLLALPPPAIVCDSSRPQFNRASCALVGEQWYSSAFHSNNPVSLVYPNWQNDACLPSAVLNDSCSYCDVQDFPNYVVNASEASHVVEAVNFAARTRVRLVVKGGAHDLLGRSTAPSSLSIWSRHLLGMTFKPSFTPASCLNASTVPAITVAAGHPMSDVYAEASKFNRTIVGAAEPDVGLGGYLTGGGHSPISATYGLAADNVLEMSVVTPSGDIVAVNACQNPDLFWAMRGGGGSTFGVLLNATLRTYPIPSLTAAFLTYNAMSQNNTSFFSATAYFHTLLPSLSTRGLMGYYTITPLKSLAPGPAPMSFTSILYVLNSSSSALHDTLDHFFSRLNATAGITASLSIQPPLGFEAFRQAYMPSAAVGLNYIAGSWLWDEKAVEDEEGVGNVLKVFEGEWLQGAFVSGPGVRIVAVDENAVNPAWRRTVVHMMAKSTYAFRNSTAKNRAEARMTEVLNKALQEQAPDMGCYLNEANRNQPGYQQWFWGEHYKRLAKLKRRVDPQGVFWCGVCVGGEDWIEKNGEICRV